MISGDDDRGLRMLSWMARPRRRRHVSGGIAGRGFVRNLGTPRPRSETTQARSMCVLRRLLSIAEARCLHPLAV